MVKNFFRGIGRWLKWYWKDILSWIVSMISYFVVFGFGFFLCFILARDEIIYLESMVESPEPEICALCRNEEGTIIHAPCLINLSTGEVAELSIYEPHPTELGEVSTELKKGFFSYYGAAGANIMCNQESELCRATLPIEIEKISPAYFCYKCRRIISDVDKEGYVLADMYDPEDARVYEIRNGSKYEIRDYLVTVNKTENKSLEVEVHGLLEEKTE